MKKITFLTMAMVSAMTVGTAMTFASCSEASGLKTLISTDNDSYVVTSIDSLNKTIGYINY